MKRAPLISGFILVAAVAAGSGYWYAKSGIAPANEAAAAAQDSSGKKILYWFDPMVPQQHFDKPGKSPFMDMQLVPKYAGEAGGERAVFVVQARSGGFVEKLHARAPLDPVAKGQPLVELLVPDWAAAQAEYLLLQRAGKDSGLAEAARNRLQLLGMSEEQIGLLEKTGQPQTRITLYAPINGVIAELGVR